jgi:serine/threonine protein kinase
MDGTKLQRQLCMDWLQSRHPKNQQQQQQQQQQSDNHKRRRIDSPSTPASLPCAESNLLQSLHHDNIIEWLDCFEDNKNVYLVTEWIDGSVLVDLHDGDDTLAYDDRQHGSPLDASTCHSVFLQLVAILDYCK